MGQVIDIMKLKLDDHHWMTILFSLIITLLLLMTSTVEITEDSYGGVNATILNDTGAAHITKYTLQPSNNSVPSRIFHWIPINITNIQDITTLYYNQIIEFNSSRYANLESYNLQNIEFFYSNGTIIPSWLESGNSNLSWSTVYYLRITLPHPIPSVLSIYMGFGNTSENFFNGINVGEAPQLTDPYGLFDNGKYVFTFYDDFRGNSLNYSKWLIDLGNGSFFVNNGLRISFNGLGYVVSRQEFSYNSTFQTYATLTGDVDNIGFFNSSQKFSGGYSGAFVREACGNTYPDQWNISGEANGCGNKFGYFLNSEGNPGIYSVQILPNKSSYQKYDGLLYHTQEPINIDTPNYPLQCGFDGVNSPLDIQWVRVLTAPSYNSSPIVTFNGEIQSQNIYENGMGGPYRVTFKENGLPNGTLWYIDVKGQGNYSSTSNQIKFTEYPGTYLLSIGDANKAYECSSPPQYLVVNNESVYETINFAPEGKLVIRVNYPSYIDINNQLVAEEVKYFTTNITYGLYNVAVINSYCHPFSEEINFSQPVQTVWANLTNSSGVSGNFYPWVPIGPYDYLNPSEEYINGTYYQTTQFASGHIGPIAIDYANPNIIYIASGNGPSYSGPLADGGIFKTTDGGLNWEPTDYGLPYSRISALFIDQQDPEILVVGMLQMGIYQTTDGGGYWYKVSDYGNVTNIIEVNGTLFASSSSGIIESVDMGRSWNILYGTSVPVEAMNISKSFIYAVLSNHSLLRSSNLGLSWQQVYDFFNISYDTWSIEASPFDPQEVFVFLGIFGNVSYNVWYSTDGGIHFSPYPNVSYSKMIKFDPQNNSIVYAIGPGYQATSFNGGRTFINGGQVTDNMDIVLDYLSPNIAVIGSDQGVYETFDYGMHWISINGNLNDSLTYGVAVNSNGSFLIADMQDYSAFVSRDSGRTWIGGNEQPIYLGGEGTFFWINQFNSSWVYAVGQNGDLMISNNSAFTFYPDGNIKGPSNYNWIDGQELYNDPLNHSRLFFGTNSGIFNMTKWGSTYSLWNNSPRNVTVITSTSNDSRFFVGTTDGIYLFKDNRWMKIQGIDAPVGSISVDPKDSSVIIVSLAGFYSFNGICISIDGGTSFNKINSNLNTLLYNLNPVYSDYPVLVSFLNISGVPLIATTSSGLFISTDLGSEWTPINYNLLSGQVTYSILVDGTLYVSTYGQGILKYPDFNISTLPATLNGNFSEYANINVTINGQQINTFQGHFTSYLPPGNYSVSIHATELNYSYNLRLTPMETLNLLPIPKNKFNITFTEIGLPHGTVWSVTLNGTTLYSTTNTITFSLNNGSYSYTIETPISGGSGIQYITLQSSGNIGVKGSNLTIYISYIAQYYLNIISNPSNGGSIKPSSGWYNASSTLYIKAVPNLNYELISWSGTGNGSYSGNNNPATITMNGPITEKANFIELYNITFIESGLPSGTSWYVNLSNGQSISGNGTTIMLSLPNGTYRYTITSLNKDYPPTPSSGTITVNGSNMNVAVKFNLLTYTLTFTESGLPSDTSWSTTLNNITESSTTNTITFQETNGTYSYAIETSIPGYKVSPSSGSIRIKGAPVSIAITFTQVKYSITFMETGLPSGTSWSVTLNGITESSTNNSIIFNEPNGSYSFAVGTISGYRANTYSGTLTVNSNSISELINWSIITYPMTITVNGITNGTEWSATLRGTTFNGQYINVTLSSTTNKITFTEPNGTYTYTLHLPSGYTTNNQKGNITVSGQSMTSSINAKQSSSSSSNSLSSNYSILIIIGMVIIIVAVIAVMAMRRKRK